MEDLRTFPHTERLVQDVVNLITLSLTTGETFLPDSSAYDDLFYKIVETGNSLSEFQVAYALDKSPASSSIAILTGVSRHYSDLIRDARGKNRNMGPKEVSKVIKQGYETLSLEARDGLDQWDRYREAEHRFELKKIARLATADSKALGLPSR